MAPAEGPEKDNDVTLRSVSTQSNGRETSSSLAGLLATLEAPEAALLFSAATDIALVINADGTAAYNSNTGMLADAANTVRMAGTTFPSLTNADLRKLMLGVLLRARRIGQFVGSGYAISIMEDIEREGKMPILREQADGSYRVKGKVFNEDEGMPDESDSAADAPFLGFGDPKTWAVVLAGAGLQIAADSSHRFRENQTGFRALGHVDIVRKPGNTWALLKTKANG